eukprot:425900-Amphidinium_carterae.4
MELVNRSLSCQKANEKLMWVQRRSLTLRLMSTMWRTSSPRHQKQASGPDEAHVIVDRGDEVHDEVDEEVQP